MFEELARAEKVTGSIANIKTISVGQDQEGYVLRVISKLPSRWMMWWGVLFPLSFLTLLFITQMVLDGAGAAWGNILFIAIMYALFKAGKMFCNKNQDYRVPGEVAFCEVETSLVQKESYKLGSGLAKAALFGASGAAWKSGNGFGAGASASFASDINTRNITFEKETSANILLLDGNVITATIPAEIASFLLGSSLFDERRQYEKYCQSLQDVHAALEDIRGDITVLKKSIEKYRSAANDAEDFQQRQNAKDSIETAGELLGKKMLLEKHLMTFQQKRLM